MTVYYVVDDHRRKDKAKIHENGSCLTLQCYESRVREATDAEKASMSECGYCTKDVKSKLNGGAPLVKKLMDMDADDVSAESAGGRP